MDKLKLLMGKPMTLDREQGVSIYQPIINDVVEIGEAKFNELVLPYVLTTEFIFNGIENEEELIERFGLFELFFTKVKDGKTFLDNIFGGKNALEVLRESLGYFLRADDIRILEKRQKIIVDNSYLIDRDEFNKIRLIIQEVVCRKDIEFERVPKNMTERQLDIWTKLQRGRKRQSEKNAMYLQDIINYVSLGGSSYIPLDQIGAMTYFQLKNAYNSVIGKDAFNIGMGYKLSQKFDVKEDIKHWTEALKIGK